MDLLTTSEREEIRGAIRDVTDTFFKVPVKITFRIPESEFADFNENQSDMDEVVFDFNGLYVPDSTDDDSEADQRKDGFADMSEGKVFVHYQDFKGKVPELINKAGEILVTPNRDSINVFGQDMDIFGVNVVGSDEAEFFLVQIQYRKRLVKKNQDG